MILSESLYWEQKINTLPFLKVICPHRCFTPSHLGSVPDSLPLFFYIHLVIFFRASFKYRIFFTCNLDIIWKDISMNFLQSFMIQFSYASTHLSPEIFLSHLAEIIAVKPSWVVSISCPCLVPIRNAYVLQTEVLVKLKGWRLY